MCQILVYIQIILVLEILKRENMQEKNWKDFKNNYGEIGARDLYEKACLSIFEAKYKNTHTVKASKGGDGGIDVFVGDLGITPVNIYQCKFFLDNLNPSQKQQIKKSLIRAVTNKDYQVKEWHLCLPKDLTKDEILWFNKLKKDVVSKYKLTDVSIDFKEGTTLINYAKQEGVYASIFNITESLQLDSIYKSVVKDPNILSSDKTDNMLYDIDKFIDSQIKLVKNYDLDKLKMLFQELAMNAEIHGHSNKITIKKEKNYIKIYDDGIKFNPLVELNNQHGGGTNILQYIQEDNKGIEFDYMYENNHNILTLTFNESDFIDSNECTLIVKNIDLMIKNAIINLIDKLQEISKNENCEILYIDIIESKIAISIKRILINKILENISCNLVLRIRNSDTFTKNFLEYYIENNNLGDKLQLQLI